MLALVPVVLAVVVVNRACGAATVAAVPRGVAAVAATAQATAYAAGACRTLQPTGGANRGRTIFVDPGHGGPDPGVLGGPRTGAKESTAALAVANELAKRLRSDGYRVVLSRSADTSVRSFSPDELTDGALDATQVRQDLQARVRCANDSHAAALVSIHFNGYDDATVGGAQTIYDDARPFADQNAKLANSLQAALVKQLGVTDRGVITDDSIDAPTLSDRADDYGHLLLLGPAAPGWLDKGTTMPGALVEPLFLTRPQEAAVASSPIGQRKIAQALAAGLENYLASASKS